MTKEIISCFLVVSVLSCVGCGSSNVVSSSPDSELSFNAFNVDAYDRSGTIVFQDEKALDARNIIASNDSTRFLNESTNLTTVVPTFTIRKVIFTNHGVGFLEGFGWGAGIGLVSGAALGLIATNGQTSSHSFGGADDLSVILAVAGLGGAAGGVAGGIWGVAAGHSYEYQFRTSTDSEKK